MSIIWADFFRGYRLGVLESAGFDPRGRLSAFGGCHSANEFDGLGGSLGSQPKCRRLSLEER